MIEFLLENGLRMEAGDYTGHTPLFWAVLWNDILMAEFLVLKGAKVNAQRDGGDTPLHLAAMDNDIPMIVTLLRLGADPNITNEKKQKPEDLAKERPTKEILRRAAEIRDREKPEALKDKQRQIMQHAADGPKLGRAARAQRH